MVQWHLLAGPQKKTSCPPSCALQAHCEAILPLELGGLRAQAWIMYSKLGLQQCQDYLCVRWGFPDRKCECKLTELTAALWCPWGTCGISWPSLYLCFINIICTWAQVTNLVKICMAQWRASLTMIYTYCWTCWEIWFYVRLLSSRLGGELKTNPRGGNVVSAIIRGASVICAMMRGGLLWE